MSTSVRPLVSPSVVSMQYYSKEAKHIVYLTFQVGGDGGGDLLTSLRITREPSSSSSGSSTWSGWMRTAWEYGQHQQRHRMHHISLFHVLGLGCPLAW